MGWPQICQLVILCSHFVAMVAISMFTRAYKCLHTLPFHLTTQHVAHRLSCQVVVKLLSSCYQIVFKLSSCPFPTISPIYWQHVFGL